MRVGSPILNVEEIMLRKRQKGIAGFLRLPASNGHFTYASTHRGPTTAFSQMDVVGKL